MEKLSLESREVEEEISFFFSHFLHFLNQKVRRKGKEVRKRRKTKKDRQRDK